MATRALQEKSMKQRLSIESRAGAESVPRPSVLPPLDLLRQTQKDEGGVVRRASTSQGTRLERRSTVTADGADHLPSSAALSARSGRRVSVDLTPSMFAK